MDHNRLKIGCGFDVHAFKEGAGFTLGGVEVRCAKSIIAHSDGDVLSHAIVDAILGALGLGDIGERFPSSDSQWKGVSSLEFLAWCRKELEAQRASIVNIDTTVILQDPPLKAYRSMMRNQLANVLAISSEALSVKLSTTDDLGFVGRNEGIAAQAVCLLCKGQDNNEE